jgi:hypothetical protein
MRNLILSMIAATALLGAGAEARASDAADRSAAIELCRSETIARAGVAEDKVRLDSARVRPRQVRVDLDLWNADGELVNVRCDVSRGASPAIVALDPPLNAAQALAR